MRDTRESIINEILYVYVYILYVHIMYVHSTIHRCRVNIIDMLWSYLIMIFNGLSQSRSIILHRDKSMHIICTYVCIYSYMQYHIHIIIFVNILYIKQILYKSITRFIYIVLEINVPINEFSL